MAAGVVTAHAYVAIRTPSDMTIVHQVLPNTTVNLSKYGTFPANSIIGRPYYLTFEILDKDQNGEIVGSGLRIVPPAELYADIEDDQPSTPSNGETKETLKQAGGVEYDVVGQNGEVVMRTNRKIIDDPKTQVLTMDEIEALKAEGISGKDMIARILESHSALDQKTAFALAKYTLRKRKKYLKRVTIFPLDVLTLAQWIFVDKEPMRIMELRAEILALIGSWSNIHYTPSNPIFSAEGTSPSQVMEEEVVVGNGRWLVVDETSGLLTAFMAEKMGILTSSSGQNVLINPSKETQAVDDSILEDDKREEQEAHPPEPNKSTANRTSKSRAAISTNTIHVIHSGPQPNLSLLKYFHFNPFNPSPKHPLTPKLKTLSWLQLLSPSEDAGYIEPEVIPSEDLQSMGSGKRSNYFRKRRRWKRIKSVVDETRGGGFDGLIVASVMQPVTILQHLVPLLRGGAQVVVYAPNLEPLSELADFYSSARRSAFLSDPSHREQVVPSEDFPVDPTLLLTPTIQTARVRSWQVLPERTHPLMMGKGGSDGFLFTATRVLPAEGKVEARGPNKRRKVGAGPGMINEEAGKTEDTTVEAANMVEVAKNVGEDSR